MITMVTVALMKSLTTLKMMMQTVSQMKICSPLYLLKEDSAVTNSAVLKSSKVVLRTALIIMSFAEIMSVHLQRTAEPVSALRIVSAVIIRVILLRTVSQIPVSRMENGVMRQDKKNLSTVEMVTLVPSADGRPLVHAVLLVILVTVLHVQIPVPVVQSPAVSGIRGLITSSSRTRLNVLLMQSVADNIHGSAVISLHVPRQAVSGLMIHSRRIRMTDIVIRISMIVMLSVVHVIHSLPVKIRMRATLTSVSRKTLLVSGTVQRATGTLRIIWEDSVMA